MDQTSVTLVVQEQLAELTHAQRERLAFIDFSLQFFGHVARSDLINRFKTGLAASTRDFSAYKKLAPDNLVLRHQTKSYYRTDCFDPLFEHDPEAILSALSRGFGNGISSGVQPSEQCFDAVRLTHPSSKIIASIMRAIHNNLALKCYYVSLSSGKSQRAIVPHSIVNNGHRWHVRAYDRKSNSFRDFVASRFTTIEVIQSTVHVHEAAAYDQQWQTMVDLILVPHPSIQHPLAIELDYNMLEGQLTVSVRAAVAAYVLRQWQVDCSETPLASDQGYQLALANSEVLQLIGNTDLVQFA